MDSQQQAEKAISNITKGKDKKNDTMMVMAPFANWDRFLTPAPSAIAILGELLLISTTTDFTLRDKMPENGFQYIKYPDSFRACLVQVSNSGWNAFNEAHTSMDQIRLTSANVDTHVKEAVRILMAGTPIEVQKVLPLTLKNIEQIADDSLELAQNIEKKFRFVMHLTEELLEASTNTKSVYDRKEKDTETQIEVAKLELKTAEESKKERERRYQNMEKQVLQAQEEYTKAVEEIPGSLNMLGVSFAEGMIDSVKALISLPTDIIKGLGSGSYDIVRGMISKNLTRQTAASVGPQKPLDARLAEHNVLSVVSQIDGNIMSIEKIIGLPGDKPDLNALKDGMGIIMASLQRNAITVAAEKESGKIGQRVSDVCKQGVKLCELAHELTDSLNTSDSKVCDLQKEVLNLRKESMILVAKAKKKLGRNPLDERSPCLQDLPIQSGALNVLQASTANARLKTELAKEILRDAREREDASVKQLEQANDRLTKILQTMKTLNIEKIDFDTVRQTLQEGIRALAEVRAQWGMLVIFFEEISNIIKCCMNTSLKKFVETAGVGRELKSEGQMMSMAFRANMYDQTLQASRISYVVSTMAGAYVDISRDHLMDQVSKLAVLIGLDPVADKHQIIREKHSLHSQCEKSQQAIKQKIKEQHRNYEEAVDARISQIERDVEALMPPTKFLPAIQEAVKFGLSQEIDDLVG